VLSSLLHEVELEFNLNFLFRITRMNCQLLSDEREVRPHCWLAVIKVKTTNIVLLITKI